MTRLRAWLGVVTALASIALGVAAYTWLRERTVAFDFQGVRYALRSPQTIATLAIVPLLVWGSTASLVDLPRLQRGLALVVRVAVCVLLSLAPSRWPGSSRRGSPSP